MGAGDNPTVAMDGERPRQIGIKPGTVLASRFEIVRTLGEGGTGTVYAARDLLLVEDVALKVLQRGGDATALRRLRDEVRAARRIAHPNVCRVHDLVEHGGQVFVVMELLSGDTLRKRMRRALPVPHVVDVLRQLGAGLSAAHRAGVVHCDVKPENALVCGARVVLTDFGIARIMASADLGARAGQLEGTPAYMAPEQLEVRDVDERTDVFALATIAYELLFLRHPFARTESEDVNALADRIRHDPPPLPEDEPAALAPDTRAEVRRVLARGLAKKPIDRYESADALVAALVAAIGAAARSRPAIDADQTPASGEVAYARTVLPRAGATPTPGGGTGVTPSRAHERATRGSRRVATIVHVLVEERQTDDVDEEQAAERAEALVAAAQAALVDAGGELVSRAPRAAVAVFGASTSEGDEPQRAADAARAVVAAAAGSRDVGVRAGIDTGRLLVRLRGDGVSVAGDAVTRAAALAGAASPGEVVASPRAARHLGRRFAVEPAGSGAVRVGPRRPAGDAVPRAALIGRDEEIQRVVSELASVPRAGRPRGVLVVGPPGIGKSRLRREVTDHLGSLGVFRLLLLAARPVDVISPNGALQALLKQLLGLGDGPSPDEIEAATRRIAGDEAARDLVDGLVAVLAPISPFGGMVAADATHRSLPLGAGATARRALAAAACTQPILLVLDDLHWADDATLDLVEAIARGEVEAPIAILAQARSELLDRRSRARGSFGLVVDLGPLPPDRAIELATLCLTSVPGAASPEASAALAEAAEGNPFFIEELARDLDERGGARQAAAGALPTTVEQAIQARLDRLHPSARDVLRAATVLGRAFRRADLREVILALDGGAPDGAQLETHGLDQDLADLEARQILFALPPDATADDRYAIKHALIRDVAYRELAPATRRALHGAAARLILKQDGDAGELARHLEGAEDRTGAVAAFRRAGERADAQDAPADALRCYERARALSGDTVDAELLVRLGDAAVKAGRLADAEKALDEAVARAGDGPACARALRARALVSRQLGRWEETITLCRRGLALVSGDPVTASQLHAMLGWVAGYILGDTRLGLEECQMAVALLEDTPHLADLGRAFAALGGVYMRMGRWRDQLTCNRRNLEIGEKIGSLELRQRANLNLGVNLAALGETEESIAHSREALALAERMCAGAMAGLSRCNLGGALVDAGRLDEAEPEVRESLRLSSVCGGLYYHYEAELYLARILARRGDTARARLHAEAAVARASRDGAPIDEGISRKLLGAVLSMAGDHEAATAELDRAAELLATADLGEAARIVAERARAALRRGDVEAAARLIDEARRKLETLGARLDLDHVGDVGWI